MKRAQMLSVSMRSRDSLRNPSFVGVHDEIVVAAQQPVIEIDDAAHDFGGKMRMQP